MMKGRLLLKFYIPEKIIMCHESREAFHKAVRKVTNNFTNDLNMKIEEPNGIP